MSPQVRRDFSFPKAKREGKQAFETSHEKNQLQRQLQAKETLMETLLMAAVLLSQAAESPRFDFALG